MASAVFGGFIAPIMCKIVSSVLCHDDGILAGRGLDPVPVSVMTSLCYGMGKIQIYLSQYALQHLYSLNFLLESMFHQKVF